MLDLIKEEINPSSCLFCTLHNILIKGIRIFKFFKTP